MNPSILVYFTLWTVATIPVVVRPDILYPASSVELERLAEEEEICYGILSKCWEKYTNSGIVEDYFVEHSLGVHQYLEDYETSSEILKLGDPQLVSAGVPGNPLASLRMLDRFVSYLTSMASSALPCPEFFEFAVRMKERFRWPDEKDVEENMLRILRLQQIYDLRTEDVAQGLLGRILTGVKLSRGQMHGLGLVAFKHKFFTFAHQWLELTLTHVEHQETEMQERVREILQDVSMEHDQTWENATTIDMQYHFDELLLPLAEEKVPAEHKVTRRDVMSKTTNNATVNYWKLCSGENLKSLEEQSVLFCWLESKVHPFWTLAPLKMELLSVSPDIARVYEIIGDGLTKKILSAGLAQLERSEVAPVTPDEGGKLTEHRTSLNSWVDDVSSPELRIVSKKAEMVTGLKVASPTSSELLQVLAYSFGGHYTPHSDCLKTYTSSEKLPLGNRIATFMYYLSDVQEGGYTAFTTAGVAAKPIKGSAVFWFSLFNDESCDNPGTRHGGCPVLLGRKYASNKWIRYYDQFHVSKCGLSPGEEIQIRQNGKPIF